MYTHFMDMCLDYCPTWHSYTPGIIYYSPTKVVLTKHDIYVLCDELNRRFGEGYSFDPEFTDGIVMSAFPGKTEHSYKVMRICPNGDSRWPEAPNNAEEWKDGLDIVYEPHIYHQNYIIPTYYKTLYGAPEWNFLELNTMCAAFHKLGFTYTKTSLSKRKLMNIYDGAMRSYL